ncbi:8291_t:CDS:2 [Funneliformis mosseae]|uniref:8291_t:CDS:1 n=1 Tax=Funneliformis mosseae TaxID=27381 RepID=A0A9N9AFQ8_FUNMO|nr:8291_t:CDS:2 [Funneliformis mosseae]
MTGGHVVGLRMTTSDRRTREYFTHYLQEIDETARPARIEKFKFLRVLLEKFKSVDDVRNIITLEQVDVKFNHVAQIELESSKGLGVFMGYVRLIY